MAESGAGGVTNGVGPEPVTGTEPTSAPRPAVGSGLPVRWLRRLGAASGIGGPLLLVAYFVIPTMIGWPAAGAPPAQLADYATSHELLFYAGGWLQVTGALLSIVFFLILLHLSAARQRLAGSATIVGCALLLSVVAIEAALLEAVPMAAATGDHATVATAFALSNGVFARIFPLAPAPLLFAATGFTLRGTRVLPTVFSHAALAVAALFVAAGIAAVFTTSGLIFAIVMSVVQALWIGAAGLALALTGRAYAIAGVAPVESRV